MTDAIGKVLVCKAAGSLGATRVFIRSDSNSGADISRDGGPRLTVNTRPAAATLGMRPRTCRLSETSPPHAGLASSKKAESPIAPGMNPDRRSPTSASLPEETQASAVPAAEKAVAPESVFRTEEAPVVATQSTSQSAKAPPEPRPASTARPAGRTPDTSNVSLTASATYVHLL